jgi:hypothetical protein
LAGGVHWRRFLDAMQRATPVIPEAAQRVRAYMRDPE